MVKEYDKELLKYTRESKEGKNEENRATHKANDYYRVHIK